VGLWHQPRWARVRQRLGRPVQVRHIAAAAPFLRLKAHHVSGQAPAELCPRRRLRGHIAVDRTPIGLVLLACSANTDVTIRRGAYRKPKGRDEPGVPARRAAWAAGNHMVTARSGKLALCAGLEPLTDQGGAFPSNGALDENHGH